MNGPRRAAPRAGLLAAAVAATILFATAAVYRDVGGYGFVFDDGGYIVTNLPVLRGLGAGSLRWALTATYTGNWHPLTWISHLIDISLFGPAPGPAHLVNLAVHLLNTLLVFLVLRRLTGALWPSAFVAAVFGVHPLHVESVAWVSERKDVLSALFWLMAVAAYARHAAQPGASRLALVAALLALGFAAKAMVMTLPAVLLLLDWWPLGRLRPGGADRPAVAALLREKVPLVAIALAGGAVALYAQRAGGAMGALHVYRPAWRAANAVISYAVYLGKTLWPAGLAVYYPFRLEAPAPAATVAAAGVLAALTAAAFALRRRAPALLAGWAWYLVTLLPVIGLVQVGGQARADRYLYLPMIGLGVAAAWGAPRLAAAARARGRGAAAGLAALAAASLVAQAAAASRQAGYWRSNDTLFERAIAVTGENWVAHSFLAAERMKRGRLRDGLDHAREAVRLNPSSAPMRYNLGLALADAGLAEEALREFRAVLWQRPGFLDAQARIAALLVRLGRLPEALDAFREAARLTPGRAEVWIDLGDTAARLGLLDEAEGAFREAVRLQPGNALARWNLERVRAARGPASPRQPSSPSPR